MKETMNGVQTYRNPKLVHILDKLQFIENYGTRIPRTLLAYNNTKKKTTFIALDNYFIVKLPNLNYNNDQINDQINDFGLKILIIIKIIQGLKYRVL